MIHNSIKFLIVLVLLSHPLSAQSYKSAEFFRTSKNMTTGGIVIDSVKRIYFDLVTDGDIFVKTWADKHYIFRRDTIWGYRYSSHVYRRAGSNGWYRIEAMGPITIYNDRNPKHENYFFSKDLGSGIYLLDAGNIKRVFHDDSPFLQALTQSGMTQSYVKKNDVTGEYKIIELYNQVHK